MLPYSNYTRHSQVVVMYNMMYINMECTTGVLCELAFVGCTCDGAGKGAAAGAAFFTHRFMSYKQVLSASSLFNKTQSPCAAPAQMRCGSACVGCACDGAGGGSRAVAAAKAAFAAEVRRGARWRLPAERAGAARPPG